MHGQWEIMQHHGDFMGVGGFPNDGVSLRAVRALQVLKHHDSHFRSARRLEQGGISGEGMAGKHEDADQYRGVEKSLHTRDSFGFQEVLICRDCFQFYLENAVRAYFRR